MPARIAMIAITTSNSMRVKPLFLHDLYPKNIRLNLSGTHSNVEFEITIAIFMTARGKLSNLGAETNDLYPSKPSSTVINIISRIGCIIT
tara:strand:- start:849 stop:1118 length:270 start_codon:yes stop_codon:yes gene_type:complete